MSQLGGTVRRGGRRREPAAVAALVLALAALVLGGASATAASSDDYASSFHVDFTIKQDGSVDVAETIAWHFPDGEARHGIERYVVVRAGYQDRENTYREYPISKVSASSPSGAPSDVSVSDAADGASVRIRVGNPDQTVSGTQRYVVRYTLEAIVNGFPDHAELYYNLVGSANDALYENVSASVTGPGPADRAECFYGELGSTDRCTATPGATAQFSAPRVEPGQGVSILASLPRDGFGALEPVLHEGEVSSDGGVVTTQTSRALGALALGTGAALPLLAAGLMGTLVYTRGRDEQYAGLTPGLAPGAGESAPVVRGGKRVTAVQFTPPQGVQPGLVGTVIDETANTVDVSATLVDLAVRGYLTIEETEKGAFRSKDWQLTRTAPTAEQARTPLQPYEEALLNGVFSTASSVRLSSLKNHFKPTLSRVQGLMYDEVVRRGWFRRSPAAQRGAWTTLGSLMIFGPIFASVWLGGAVSRLGAGSGSPVPPGFALAGGCALAGAIVVFLGRRMAARTAAGSAVLAQSEGFKQYLVTAEAAQIRWEEAQDVFSRYLPYAIVFGVASQWAATFEKVAEAAAAAGHVVTPPLWYLGGNFGSFSGIADGMDSFATTAGGTFTSTPGSSGGSGFSAGGGFSGGGGGGSSGGSW
ncbi:hypothetical protein GCM10025782_22430 [Pedococcus ginsenosidimutans]|uniref:DUF2207 domain-containing protein n=1 Tax=Pedococcus ginsenosidimutans TaxID=490570 RepID=A0ABP8Y9L7_9MICO